MEIRYGAKYDKDLNTTEIAKRFRGDVGAAKKAGELPPELKLGVRTQYFSGGSSIDVTVKVVPAGFRVSNPARGPAAPAFDDQGRVIPPLAPDAEALLKKLTELLGAYNFDGSEPQTDYFHVRFYSRVEFSSALRRAVR